MLGAIKTLGTVLTLASSAKFGKEMYETYKDKKRARQVAEVHDFIASLNMQELEDAIKSKDNDKLIDAVEAIMCAAESIKIKNEFDELKDDVTDVAKNIFETVSMVATKVATKVTDGFDKISADFEDTSKPSSDGGIPTYKQFKNGGQVLVVNIGSRRMEVTIDDDNVSTNDKSKTVTVTSTKNGKTRAETVILR